jgi:hypothetical protein
VPGDLRKFVSAVVAIGLAIAPTAERRVKMAADAAIRTKLMAVLFFPALVTAPSQRLFNCSGGLAFKGSHAPAAVFPFN